MKGIRRRVMSLTMAFTLITMSPFLTPTAYGKSACFKEGDKECYCKGRGKSYDGCVSACACFMSEDCVALGIEVPDVFEGGQIRVQVGALPFRFPLASAPVDAVLSRVPLGVEGRRRRRNTFIASSIAVRAFGTSAEIAEGLVNVEVLNADGEILFEGKEDLQLVSITDLSTRDTLSMEAVISFFNPVEIGVQGVAP